MKLDFDSTTQIIFVGVAAAGGMTKYLFNYVETGHFKWQFFIAHIAMSAFSGWMFAGFAEFLGVKETGLFLFAGVGGYMGTKALELIQGKLTQDIDEEEEKVKMPKKPTTHHKK